MVAAILSALIQLALVLAVAFVAYLAMRRPGRSFASFIGFLPAPAKAIAAGIAVGLFVSAAALLIPGVADFAGRQGTSAHQAGKSGGLGLLLGVAFFRAVIQTSLTEEIFFRGLIGRNLIRRIGFRKGNAIQAALFGVVHGLIAFIPGVTWLAAAVAILFSGAFGWLNGWLNERLGGGSILPGWAAHATANLVTNVAVALMIWRA